VRNAARPPVRAQIHPDALALIDRYYPIAEGYHDDGSPRFTGIPYSVWCKLRADPRFPHLVQILSSDYPTFAALVQKIWAKRVGRLVPLIFNRTQVLAWGTIAERIAKGQVLFIVFFKARQMGISTLVNGLAHWHVWRLHDIEVTLVAHEKPLVFSFIDRLRIFHEELPEIPGIARHLRQSSKSARVPREEMYYQETRSKIATVVAKNAEARGRSAPHYHLAEYAFYDGASDLLAAIMPQLPAAGTPARLQCSVLVESTPNGKNDFYDLWQHAESEDSEWCAKFFPWYVQEDEYSLDPPAGWMPSPERIAWAKNLAHLRRGIDGTPRISKAQLYWYERTLEDECEGDQDKMDREYPSDPETAFLLRSRGIFKDNMRYLQACVVEAQRRAPAEFRKRNLECSGNFVRGRLDYDTFDNPFGRLSASFTQLRLKPAFVADPKGSLWVWSPPQDGHEYVIGIDAAAGTFAGDYSCAEVLDVTEGKQVAELWYKRAPEELTDDCVALGWWYNVALLYPEINSIGVVCMKRAKQVWQYPRVGREEKWDEIGVKQHKYGHYTTWESKQIMISFFKHVVEEQHLAIASDGLLSEMSTFIETAGGDFEGDGGSHDDRVMAMALALAVVRQSPRMLAGFSNRHEPAEPDAVDAMIHSAPVVSVNGVVDGKTASERQRVPEEVRKLLDGTDLLAVPSNPIRGIGIDLPW
jgi:hypothetical protein